LASGDIGGVPGFTVFTKKGGKVFRAYSTYGRGLEPLNSLWAVLDMLPLGRNGLWPRHREEIEAELAAQPGHVLGDGFAAGTADDISAKQNLHASDKGASTAVGQQPIQPLIARAMRHLGYQLRVEAHAHGRHLAPGPQAGERAVVEATAIA